MSRKLESEVESCSEACRGDVGSPNCSPQDVRKTCAIIKACNEGPREITALTCINKAVLSRVLNWEGKPERWGWGKQRKQRNSQCKDPVASSGLEQKRIERPVWLQLQQRREMAWEGAGCRALVSWKLMQNSEQKRHMSYIVDLTLGIGRLGNLWENWRSQLQARPPGTTGLHTASHCPIRGLGNQEEILQ